MLKSLQRDRKRELRKIWVSTHLVISTAANAVVRSGSSAALLALRMTLGTNFAAGGRIVEKISRFFCTTGKKRENVLGKKAGGSQLFAIQLSAQSHVSV